MSLGLREFFWDWGPPTSATPCWASASSNQVVVHGWLVYDATTGPVHPPAIDAPRIFLDDAVSAKRRLLGTLASSTADAVHPPTIDAPQVFSDDGGLRKQRRAGAFASSTAEPIFVPAAVTGVGSFSNAVVRHSWSIYDPTTGPVLPPTAAPPPFAPPQSELARRNNKIFPPLPTQVVIAIPIDDLWFEALDTPVRIKGKRQLAETVQPLTLPAIVATPSTFWLEALDVPVRIKGKGKLTESVQPLSPSPAVVVAPLASASSSQVTINTWSVYDPTTGPVLPQGAATPPPFAPPQSEIARRNNKIFRPLPTNVVIAIPVDDLWFEALDTPVRIKAKGRLSETVQPILPPIVVAPPILGANWLEQSLTVSARRKGTFDPTAAVLQPVTAPIVAPLASASSSQITIHSWFIYDSTTGPVLPQAAAPPPTVTAAEWIIRARRRGRR